MVNLALLGKWRWRLISGEEGLWLDIVRAKYGPLGCSSHLGGRVRGFRGVSSWWKEISLLGVCLESLSDWFSTGVRKVVGNGLSTSFWFDPWLGEVPLKVQFPRLFQVSINQESQVGSFGKWDGGVWVWEFRWRRRLFVWEQELLHGLLVLLDSVSMSLSADSWSWKFEPSGMYSVKSAYLSLLGEVQ
ncbi:hypothetical protein TSUD_412300 [Trifolium subterraneum]|uniref:Reverse transcriptase zinc-binding domain-containing protein n=1 Tax=Trifolium subterraneum TaxID=3900 RepID=A0A2Z6P481_TRISU|nr:hypothetical protein TSUD_412300 [Trifolium subterraneum]